MFNDCVCHIAFAVKVYYSHCLSLITFNNIGEDVAKSKKKWSRPAHFFSVAMAP